MERERSVGKPTNELNDLRTRGVETWGQTQKVRMSDEEAHRKKEAKKAKVETWDQTQKVGEKEMSDEEARRKKEAEKAKLQKKLAKATEDVEGSDESEVSVEETDPTAPASMLRKEKKREK